MSQVMKSNAEIKEIPVVMLSPNPHQPRRHFDEVKIKELADSIQQEGQIQPILVRQLQNGDYELIAGERRLRAHQALGRETISAIVKDVNVEDALIITLVENLQREDLTLMEEAFSLDVLLKKHNSDYQGLAKKIGKSLAYVKDRVSLLNLSKEVQKMLDAGELNLAQAKVILDIKNESAQAHAAKLSSRLNLSANELRGRTQDTIQKRAGIERNPGFVMHDKLLVAIVELHDGLQRYEFKMLRDHKKRAILLKQMEVLHKAIVKALSELNGE